jgi:hypothetical protein
MFAAILRASSFVSRPIAMRRPPVLEIDIGERLAIRSRTQKLSVASSTSHGGLKRCGGDCCARPF